MNFNFWCLAIVCIAHLGDSQHWHYGDETHWPDLCTHGKQQSPIPLAPEGAIRTQYSSFIFEGYNQDYPVYTKNNGHSVEVRLHVEQQPTVRGGGLPNVYVLDHLHFHWKSEHTVEDYRFPLELHIVNYAQGYKDLTEALNYKDGVAVLAILYDISPDDDTVLIDLLDRVDKVHDKVDAVQTLNFNIKNHIPRDTAGFYRYNGSLTTPQCTEGVIWTIFTNTLPISKAQVASFNTIEAFDHSRLGRNYRPLQDVNDRPVFLKVSPVEHPHRDNGAGSLIPPVFYYYFIVMAAFSSRLL